MAGAMDAALSGANDPIDCVSLCPRVGLVDKPPAGVIAEAMLGTTLGFRVLQFVGVELGDRVDFSIVIAIGAARVLKEGVIERLDN